MVSLCACDLATHGHWFVDIRCANMLSFFPPPLLALAAFFLCDSYHGVFLLSPLLGGVCF